MDESVWTSPKPAAWIFLRSTEAPMAEARRALKMATLLGDGGFPDEAAVPVAKAVIGAATALHALTLVFSTTEGGFVTDVATRVDDPLGDRRVEASCGPLGQLDVPEAGRYRVTATYAGQTQEHWLDLSPGGGARLALRWQE